MVKQLLTGIFAYNTSPWPSAGTIRHKIQCYMVCVMIDFQHCILLAWMQISLILLTPNFNIM